jgi:hypothetical protein
MAKPKIGASVVWTSLDPTVPSVRGKITQVSPSGNKVEVQWEDQDEGETMTYDLTDKASGVRLSQ